MASAWIELTTNTPNGTTGYHVRYSCPACGNAWSSQWSCACDDDCPSCGATTEAASFRLDGTHTQAELDTFNNPKV